jgi:hypothetical protein
VATAEFRGLTDVRQYWWLYLPLVGGLALWCVIDVMPRGGINWKRIHEHRTDFTVYTEAGAAFFDGRNPYEVANPRGWRYLYPPLFAILVSPLHAIPSTGQVAIWFTLSCLMAVGCYFEMRRLADLLYFRTAGGERRAPLMWVGFAALLAVLLPCLNCLQRGQVEVLKLYLLLVGFRVLVAGRSPRAWFLSGVVFAGAGILKLTPLLPVGCLILYDVVLSLAHRWDRLPRLRAASLTAGLGTGVLLFAFALPACFIGWSANSHHLGTWFSRVVTKVVDVRTSDFGEDVRTVRNQSLDNSAYRFGNWFYAQFADGPDDTVIDRPHGENVWLPMDTPLAGEMIVLARVFAFAMLLLFVVQAARRDRPLGRATAFGLACVATLVVCPVARGCYFALFLPAIVFTSMLLLRLGRPRTAMTLAIVPVVAVWAHYVAVTFSGRLGVLGLCTAAWFVATCALLDKCLAPPRGEPQCATLTIPAETRVLEPV